MSNLHEMAIACTARYKEKYDKDGHVYINTLYVAIDENNNVKTSTMPAILDDAYQCILIHHRSTLAISNRYDWYKIERIDQDGGVHDESLDNEYILSISACGSWDTQQMSLKKNGRMIYSCRHSFWHGGKSYFLWENEFMTVWQLYLQCKQCKSTNEAILLGKIVEKEHSIDKLKEVIKDFEFESYFLNKEIDQYKSLLKKISDLVEQ